MRTLCSVAALQTLAHDLLTAAGLAPALADIVARQLGEAELLGRDTHGFVLLDWYLADLQSGAMRGDGEVCTVADHGAAVVWDARRLPGAVVLERAIDVALARLRQHPVVTIAIRESHHLGCHAVYVRRAAVANALALLMDTNPGYHVVAPFGSTEPVYSPTPLGIGIPHAGEPIVIDFSLSSCSSNRVKLSRQRRERLPGKWLIDASGIPTDDPEVLFADPPGSILPLGGADLGYKGFALALMAYALSAGLAGHDVDDDARGSYSAVFLQLIDPERFSGRSAFGAIVSDFVHSCRAAGERTTKNVHIPGEQHASNRAAALRTGVAVDDDCLGMLARWARVLSVAIPELAPDG